MGTEGSIAAQLMLVLCSCVLIFLPHLKIRSPFMGRLASPFIGERKVRVIEEKKGEEREREEGF